MEGATICSSSSCIFFFFHLVSLTGSCLHWTEMCIFTFIPFFFFWSTKHKLIIFSCFFQRLKKVTVFGLTPTPCSRYALFCELLPQNIHMICFGGCNTAILSVWILNLYFVLLGSILRSSPFLEKWAKWPTGKKADPNRRIKWVQIPTEVCDGGLCT